MTATERMIRRLPDVYSKLSDSNIEWLLSLPGAEINGINAALELTELWRNIDVAEGATLDLIGYNIQQWRGAASDPVYRILIKSKIISNMSDGSINTIISALSTVLGIDPSEIIITELYELTPPEPAAISIEIDPEILLEAGVTFNQTAAIVYRMIAAGVRLDFFSEGTFELSSSYDPAPTDYEFDDEAGFNGLDTNEDPLDTGGWFGWLYSPADEPELPI